MASNINPNNIDGAYPVAGQDNDSQGFRDNFTNIKTSFQFAKEEIEALQNSAVTLTGVNNMSGGTIVSATLKDVREAHNDVAGGIVTLDHALGHSHYYLTTGVGEQISFLGWPTSGFCRMRLQVNVAVATHTIILPSTVHFGLDGLQGYNSTTREISFNRIGRYDFEFTSFNGGTDVTITDLTRNGTLLVGVTPPASKYGAAGHLKGMVAFQNIDYHTTYMYYCFKDYTTGAPDVIWNRVTLTDW